MFTLHTIAPGETLYSIAASYGISVARLIADNYIPSIETPIVGQALLILFPEELYTVKEGDTLTGISQSTGVSQQELLRNNPSLIGNSDLYPGQTLVLSYNSQRADRISSNGYAYPFIQEDALSFALPFLSEVTVFTYGFDRQGNLIPPVLPDQPLIEKTREAGSSATLLLSTLGPDGTFNSNLPTVLFEDPAAFDRLTEQLLATMREKGYSGIEVDFEYLLPESRDAYSQFIRDLTRIMNDNGYPLSVALAPKTYKEQPGLLYEAHDYEALGQAANRVLLMTYEWGYTYGPPSAVAPIDKVSEVLDYALSVIDPEKISLGIPGYGYDWTLPYTPGTAARSLSPNEALDLAGEYGAEILFEESSASPYFFYTDREGKEHVVYFEDVRSYKAKIDLIVRNGLTGFSFWTIMKKVPQFFLLANAIFDL